MESSLFLELEEHTMNKMESPLFATQLSLQLNATPPLDLSRQIEHFACVSVILKGSPPQLELAFIERADDPADRWSGHLAFPGGKHEITDKSPLDTALRETQEEVGISLTRGQLLGQLNDIQARRGAYLLPFFIRPFVFYIGDSAPHPILDITEVADFFWVSLEDLTNPSKLIDYKHPEGHIHLKLQAVELGKKNPLWGLTYIMTLDLLKKLPVLSQDKNLSKF